TEVQLHDLPPGTRGATRRARVLVDAARWETVLAPTPRSAVKSSHGPRAPDREDVQAGVRGDAHAAERDVSVHESRRAPIGRLAEDARVTRTDTLVRTEGDPIRVAARAPPL